MARTARTSIPLHRLKEEHPHSLHLRRVARVNNEDLEEQMEAHRDDHCLFMLQERGCTTMLIDFETVRLEAGSLFCIMPGQVHCISDISNVSGWLLAFDPLLAGESVRDILEEAALSPLPLLLQADALQQLTTCLELLQQRMNTAPDALLQQQITRALLSSFLGMAAVLYQERANDCHRHASRQALIVQEFRKLLRREWKHMKSPAAYAAALHLSLSYLNETVKAVTGFTVSRCIHQEIMLEARRLLWHSDMSVKEVAYELGYEDHTYFSRLFKKVIGDTPGDFRSRHRG